QLVGADPGKPNSLASLGIITGSWEEKGKLYIENADEDSGEPNKLRAAIAKDPEGVAKLLNTLGEQLYKEHDKTLRTSNELKSAMNFYNDKAMNDKMKTFDKQIKTLEDRMFRMEDMYYAKFAAMEKMLSALNNQSSWLAQQFGGY
ncbi:MAG TPA: flagellar filament capping protein FliD, partial [Epulopiscium sp.]|nr:flagellar filament capping protein FliD [Candidatus Epulonipiscium sp.]